LTSPFDIGPSWHPGPADAGLGWLRRLPHSVRVSGPKAVKVVSALLYFIRIRHDASDALVAKTAGCSASHARATRRSLVAHHLVEQAPQRHRLTPRGWRSFPLHLALAPLLRSLLSQVRQAAYLRFKRFRRASLYPHTSDSRERTSFWRDDFPTFLVLFGSFDTVCSLAPPGRA